MIKKILFAYSGTENSQQMLKYLREIPAIKSASINVLHVVPSQITTDGMAEKLEQGGKILAEVIQALGIEPNQVSSMLRQGEPKDTVCKVAQEIDADLIIMGSRGLQRLESFLENSVSQYVFQLTDRPMLLVKDDIYVKRIKKVMVALDRSEASQSSLDLALYLLRDYPEAKLFIFRVNPDLSPKLLPLSQSEMEKNPVVAEAITKAKGMGVKYSCLVTGGRPSTEICQAIEENNVDLLVMGSPDRRPSIAKGLPDLDRLLGSSLSDYVRVNASCPVLLTRTIG